MKTQMIDIGKLKPNEDNPRYIKEDKFKILVKSIKDFPQMLDLRPIVVNADYKILGGNMRYKACVEAKLKQVPVIIAENLTAMQENEFIIKDNVSGGDWDWDVLANEWDNVQLQEWGLVLWNNDEEVDIDNMFIDAGDTDKENLNKIVLKYEDEDFAIVAEKLREDGRSPEEIFKTALKL